MQLKLYLIHGKGWGISTKPFETMPDPPDAIHKIPFVTIKLKMRLKCQQAKFNKSNKSHTNKGIMPPPLSCSRYQPQSPTLSIYFATDQFSLLKGL